MSVMVPPVAPMPYLDLHRGADGPRLDHAITDCRAWTRDTVTAHEWTVPLGDAALAEIRELAATLARDPLPTLLLTPDRRAT